MKRAQLLSELLVLLFRSRDCLQTRLSTARIRIVRKPIATLSFSVCLAFGSSSWALPLSATPSLKIGDAAPAVEEVTWLQGTPVTKYEPGHVYVVEFWATWCPPCLKAIPHLSALQKKYAGKLTVISINAEGPRGNIDTIHNFMSKHGNEIAYSVAMQDLIKMTMSEAWITAGGSMGLPTAGIVDGRGKLAWIGYPDRAEGYGFDEALTDTLADKTDLVRSRALQSSINAETTNYRAKRVNTK
jgi:thiol-disulfide isomerase/thioredoxin